MHTRGLQLVIESATFGTLDDLVPVADSEDYINVSFGLYNIVKHPIGGQVSEIIHLLSDDHAID